MNKYKIYWHQEDELTPYWVCCEYHSERTLFARCRTMQDAEYVESRLNWMDPSNAKPARH